MSDMDAGTAFPNLMKALAAQMADQELEMELQGEEPPKGYNSMPPWVRFYEKQ